MNARDPRNNKFPGKTSKGDCETCYVLSLFTEVLLFPALNMTPEESQNMENDPLLLLFCGDDDDDDDDQKEKERKMNEFSKKIKPDIDECPLSEQFKKNELERIAKRKKTLYFTPREINNYDDG